MSLAIILNGLIQKEIILEIYFWVSMDLWKYYLFWENTYIKNFTLKHFLKNLYLLYQSAVTVQFSQGQL